MDIFVVKVSVVFNGHTGVGLFTGYAVAEDSLAIINRLEYAATFSLETAEQVARRFREDGSQAAIFSLQEPGLVVGLG